MMGVAIRVMLYLAVINDLQMTAAQDYTFSKAILKEALKTSQARS